MKREFKDINEIIIHCSDSDFGDVDLIDQWHKERGWDGVGYHYVITNGIIAHGNEYDPKMDGEIQKGRELAVMGAHCRGHNYNSIGICLIGRHHFTGRQLLESLPNLLLMLGDLGLEAQDIHGHCEFSKKTCPNIDPVLLRMLVRPVTIYRNHDREKQQERRVQTLWNGQRIKQYRGD
jgi:N-acetylmuramoyl-L-alanine amidase